MIVRRPAPFVLMSSGHGTMIVNRNDYQMTSKSEGFGVGWQLLTSGWCEPEEVELLCRLLMLRRKRHGDGCVAVDCGANIGTVTVDLARTCAGWGRVISFEAQERVYYALAGNIAINNCLNAQAIHAAVGAEDGSLDIPVLDPTRPASFGSLELRQRADGEDIGQAVRYDMAQPVRMLRLDSMGLERLDLLKVDVEGMEFEVLAGGERTIRELQPILAIEYIKVDVNALAEMLRGWGYVVTVVGINLVAVHSTDPCLQDVRKP